MSDSLCRYGLFLTRFLWPWDSPGKNTGVDCHSLLQGIFLTQGLNPGLPHSWLIIYHLSHQGSSLHMELPKFFKSSLPKGLLRAKFSSVIQSVSCVWLCNPTYYSMPDFPVHHQHPELAQTHALWVSDTIQLSHSLPASSLPSFNLSQHQGLFQWASSSHQVTKVLEFQLQHQSFQWIFRTNFL